MKWRDIVSSGQTYSMAHLHPFTTGVQVGSRQIDLHVTFGWHVFTDEKGNGFAEVWTEARPSARSASINRTSSREDLAASVVATCQADAWAWVRHGPDWRSVIR